MGTTINHSDKLEVVFQLNTIVIQPTTLCNLNCTYCYLPNRNQNLSMSVSTAQRIADELTALNLEHIVNVLWHSGEPLTCGVNKFAELLSPFEKLRREKKIRHSIQTNATLINKEWCDLFLNYNVSVGVSIDGWRSLTEYRVYWNGQEAYEKIMKGISFLNDSKVSFGVICVITDRSISHPHEIYDFFCKLGCESVGFSIVEEEGVNKNLLLQNIEKAQTFWAELLDSWRENPIINVREFRRVTVWLESEVNDKQGTSIMKDTLPSIAYNGDVVLVSPEFLGMKPHSKYETFVVGNIFNSSLSTIINDGLEAKYIKDYVLGMEKCQRDCEYFGYCRGGDASNKYFESGSLDITRTNHCRNTKMRLVDAVLEKL